jgi:hypothetical protein
MNGALSHCAFVRMRDFKRWLRGEFMLDLAPRWKGESVGHRIGRIRKLEDRKKTS